ncbi:MAG: hypothetical protein KF781_10555 [Chitinophagaceae bacterium]|nr:hypothetical protein [Chitinophagaceae bacterium]MCW5904957.1 hypothetical protein [Chitinophagaceae bacterium]
MKHLSIRGEELKNKVAQDYFWLYDCSKIIGNVDFCVCMHQSQKELYEQESFLWAEAKKGKADIYHSIVQLILTIGKARTFDKFLPAPLLGAFDAEKIAFIPYNDIHEVFYLNDFNWNVTPSNHETKEFKLIHKKVKTIIDTKALLFNFLNDDRELKKFIKKNFIVGKFGLTKIRIDKNNFISVFNKWLVEVKPSIVMNWENAKKKSIIEADFYLADLIAQDNKTLKEQLFVRLEKNIYELDRRLNDMGMFDMVYTQFNDKQVAHTQFWNKYERPPKEEYWDYIVERRDLLVPQDVRERKGSFFTPQIWVELSQKYLPDALGEDWQDEYYVWDCAAGTGNLLAGLTNKYNIWASTLDKQDVEVMHDRINNGANLLHDHVFQFDFLNDDFTTLPQSLQNIINDENERKKLIVYINPPYAEATSAKTVTGTGKNKKDVTTQNKISEYLTNKIGNASNELFALFMAQVYDKIPNSILAQFSKLKFIQGTNFTKFKEFFKVSYLGGFVVPSNTFDNVKGNFPIGFTIWSLNNKGAINNISCDVYNEQNFKIGQKVFYGDLPQSINKWIKHFENPQIDSIGLMVSAAPDFQHNKQLAILSKQQERYCFKINYNNLIVFSVYFAVRHCIEATWLNDRDQFLYPNDGWKNDKKFQTDCLAFTLFSNNIQSKDGTNYWIPFTEYEVNAREMFDSNFMTEFINGKPKPPKKSIHILNVLFEPEVPYNVSPLQFSEEAKDVFDAGRELWKYYHQQPNCNVNASLYDIRECFQGRNEKGKMNNKSTDETYTNLISNLREKLKILAEAIEPKVYKYSFLKQ